MPCRLKYFVKGISLPDSTRKFGRTVEIHQAVSNSDHSKIREALQADTTNINLKDSNGNTALHLACQKGDSNIVRYLLGSGANVTFRDKEGYLPIHVKLIKKMYFYSD